MTLGLDYLVWKHPETRLRSMSHEHLQEPEKKLIHKGLFFEMFCCGSVIPEVEFDRQNIFIGVITLPDANPNFKILITSI